MFCHKCGAQLPDDSLFCSKCGTKLNEANETEDRQPESSPAGETAESAVETTAETAAVENQTESAPTRKKKAKKAGAVLPKIAGACKKAITVLKEKKLLLPILIVIGALVLCLALYGICFQIGAAECRNAEIPFPDPQIFFNLPMTTDYSSWYTEYTLGIWVTDLKGYPLEQIFADYVKLLVNEYGFTMGLHSDYYYNLEYEELSPLARWAADKDSFDDVELPALRLDIDYGPNTDITITTYGEDYHMRVIPKKCSVHPDAE